MNSLLSLFKFGVLLIIAWSQMGFSASYSGSIDKSKWEDRFQKMRAEMIERQIIARGIQDKNVLKAMRKVPRHEFVPLPLALSAYTDNPLPIGHGQTISQPYVVAFMTEALGIKSTDRVLEIGTGSGYQAAVLAEIASEVYTVEIIEGLYQQSQKILKKMNYENIYTKLGDGWKGWPEFAPYDKIIVTAAAEEIPRSLVSQLKERGKMIVPIGSQWGAQDLVVGVKIGEHFETHQTIPVRFVPLVHGQEGKESE